MSALVDGAAALGINLTSAQLSQLDQLQAALLESNQLMNLTHITAPADIEVRHFLDSLTAALPLLDRLKGGEPIRLIDVGSGPGMPGLPLKIAFPNIELCLLEATRKKARYLQQTVDLLCLGGVEVVAERAETAAASPQYRDAFQWATARAIGPLPQVIELCAPFLEPGGLMVAQRRGNLDEQLQHAAPAFKALKLWA